MREEDIVLIKNNSKYDGAKFRLGRVLGVHSDIHGVVRAVTGGLRDRRGRKVKWNHCGGTLAEMAVGVQRLVVVPPAEEQEDPADVQHGAQIEEEAPQQVCE